MLLYSLQSLKGIVQPKNKNSVIITLRLFQTCVPFSDRGGFSVFSFLSELFLSIKVPKMEELQIACMKNCPLKSMYLKAGIHYMTFKIGTDFKTLGIIHLPTL